MARHVHLQHGEWFLYAAVYWIGSFVVCISMALAIEFPVLKLRNRWFSSEVGLPAKAKPDAPALSPASTD